MKTCWKCSGALRDESPRFCPRCGAEQKADERHLTDWQTRIEQRESGPNVPASLFWLLLGPGLLLVFPFILGAAYRRLRWHNLLRSGAPVFNSSIFADAEHGRSIAARLKQATGRPGAGGGGVTTLLVLALVVFLGIWFILPATAPASIRYERAMEGMMEVEPATLYHWVFDEADYHEAWRRLARTYYSYDRVTIETRRLSSWEGNSYPIWNGRSDRPGDYRPYRYSVGPGFGRGVESYQVSGIRASWTKTEGFGVVFYIAMGVLYVLMMAFGIRFWVLFARHAREEALAAAYARQDLAYHDQLMARVSARNTLVVLIGTILAITQLQVVLFPILSTVLLARHAGWERKQGVGAALGV